MVNGLSIFFANNIEERARLDNYKKEFLFFFAHSDVQVTDLKEFELSKFYKLVYEDCLFN
jgi:hypothetical protein